MNYEFNLLHRGGVVAKRLHAAADTAVRHEGEDITLSGPIDRRAKNSLPVDNTYSRMNTEHMQDF